MADGRVRANTPCVLFCTESFGHRLRALESLYAVPGGAFAAELLRQAQALGWQAQLVTGDADLRKTSSGPLHLISEMGFLPPLAMRLPDLRSTTIFSLESPLQSKRFHIRLGAITRKFDRALLFGGLVTYSRARRTSTIRFPMYGDPLEDSGFGWGERRQAALVCSPKTVFHFIGGGKERTPTGLLKDATFLATRVLVATIRARELYTLRLRLAAETPGLDIFGHHWDRFLVAGEVGRWRGPIDAGVAEKRRQLARYRFNLCMENCCMAGYVTEKIYDSLLSGVVPVYIGAPDIVDYVPAECFVDGSGVQSGAELARLLAAISAEEWQERVEAGKAFLKSTAYKKTLASSMASSLLAEIRAIS